jgi:UDP:flavonoid glycosyltransferase YjiC (YdhE family)
VLAGLAGPAGSGLRVAATRFTAYERALPPWAAAGPGRQGPALAAAAATGGAVVCGGGHGMVAKALVHGLPVVAVPRVGDQRENAARVARAGAGVVVPARRLRPEALAAAVLRVVADPAYRLAARRLGASAAGLGSDHAAAVALGEFARIR